MVSVCHLLVCRELGIAGKRGLGKPSFKKDRSCESASSIVQSNYILRKLVCSETRSFSLCSKKGISAPQGSLVYYEGKIWLKNVSKKCFEVQDLRDKKKTKSVLYSIASQPRWVDQDIWCTPTDHSVSRGSNDHLSSLFILRQHPNQCLERFDVRSGNLLQTIKLPGKTRFLEMNCDDENSTIVLKSRKWPYPKPSTKSGLVLAIFLIFDFPPLQFRSHVEISGIPFGRNIVDAEINRGILFVMTADQVVNLFSMEYILKHFQKEGAAFHDITEPNVEITEMPPVLFKISSEKHYLQLSDFIPYSLVAVQGKKFQFFDLESSETIQNSVIAKKDYFEENEIILHPDGSPRVIHIQGSKIRILTLEKESQRQCLKEVFVMDVSKSCSNTIETQSFDEPLCPKLVSNVTKNQESGFVSDLPRRSSFGRTIRKPLDIKMPSGSDDDSDENIALDFYYDSELDLIVLLVYRDIIRDQENDDDADGTMATKLESVIFIDNFSLEIVKELTLNMEISKSFSVRNSSITFDKDILLIRENNSSNIAVIPFLMKELHVEKENKKC